MHYAIAGKLKKLLRGCSFCFVKNPFDRQFHTPSGAHPAFWGLKQLARTSPRHQW